MASRWPDSGAFLMAVLCWAQLAGVPVEDRMRRTPAAPARASGTSAGSGEDVSGSEAPPAAHPSAPASKAAPTHSLWMLSRKFVRLLLTTQVRPSPAICCKLASFLKCAVQQLPASVQVLGCAVALASALHVCCCPHLQYNRWHKEPSLCPF